MGKMSVYYEVVIKNLWKDRN